MNDEEKLENVARELCRAAGSDPDAMVRLGQPLSFAAGECTVLKPLFVPAWKAYSREARRLAMSDAEHAEGAAEPRKPRRRRTIVRLMRSPRMLAIVLRRHWRRRRFVARLRTLYRRARQSLSPAPLLFP